MADYISTLTTKRKGFKSCYNLRNITFISYLIVTCTQITEKKNIFRMNAITILNLFIRGTDISVLAEPV